MSIRCDTPRELEHQLRDSGAKAIVIVENFAHTLWSRSSPGPGSSTSSSRRWVTCRHDRGTLVNFCRPPRQEDGAGLVAAGDQHQRGWPPDVATGGAGPLSHDDLAFLQYTGGTRVSRARC